eukprot:6189962-Pleurochrysis_carterae.AAC.1
MPPWCCEDEQQEGRAEQKEGKQALTSGADSCAVQDSSARSKRVCPVRCRRTAASCSHARAAQHTLRCARRSARLLAHSHAADLACRL